jgi:hypothetical protein
VHKDKAKQRSLFLKGKSYVELFGVEKALEIQKKTKKSSVFIQILNLEE